MNFYAVWKGRKTGLFTTWPECAKQVKGFNGAQFKKITANSKADAEIEFKKGYSSVIKTSKKDTKVHEVKDLHKTEGLVYFTDGACLNNSKAKSPSGSGISCFLHGELTNLYYGGYTEEGSNNIGELKSMLACLKIIENEEPFSATIYADSMYVINSITKWAKNWISNGWKKANNKPVENKDIIKEIYELYLKVEHIIEIRHVRAHIGELGNELADRMSILASNKKEAGWAILDDKDIDQILKIKHNK